MALGQLRGLLALGPLDRGRRDRADRTVRPLRWDGSVRFKAVWGCCCFFLGGGGGFGGSGIEGGGIGVPCFVGRVGAPFGRAGLAKGKPKVENRVGHFGWCGEGLGVSGVSRAGEPGRIFRVRFLNAKPKRNQQSFGPPPPLPPIGSILFGGMFFFQGNHKENGLPF